MPKKDVDNMLIKDLLSDDDRSKLQSLNKSTKRKQNEKHQYKPIKLNEKLTTREWKELMGTKRDTYRRVNGKVKRK